MAKRNVGGVDRIARGLLAVCLTVLAVRALRSGNRSLGGLAALGALGAGFNATTCFCGVNAMLGLDTSGSAE
jgi:hypothetical protein